CEHLAAAAARLVEALLRGCPTLRVLATSRERLKVPGEIAWRVPSLESPDEDDASSIERVVRSDAGRLFCDRASAVRPEFVPVDQDARAVVQICRRLDGIPLALELAAAWVRVLTVEQ